MTETPPSAVKFMPLEDQHVADAMAIYNHYVTNSTATFHDRPVAEAEFREQVFYDDPRHASYAIVDQANGSLVGYCSLGPYKQRGAYRLTAETTVYLRPERTARGIGAEAARLLEQRARTQGFHALMAVICQENRASAKLLVRQGFELVGRRKEVGYKFGRFLDVEEYEKILR